jgi:hypothetical protein
MLCGVLTPRTANLWKELKMRVKLRTTYASPKITALPGSVIDVPEKEAVDLVGGGFAEYCKESKVETVEKKSQKPAKAKDSKKDESAKDKKADNSKKDEAAKGNKPDNSKKDK